MNKEQENFRKPLTGLLVKPLNSRPFSYPYLKKNSDLEYNNGSNLTSPW